MVVAEPKLLSGGGLRGISFACLMGSGKDSAWFIEGRDGTGFKVFLVTSATLEVSEDAYDGSTVCDLRIGIDLGVGDSGGDLALVEAAGHRSRTDDLRAFAFLVRSDDGEADPLVTVEGLSSCVLTLTMFWTNPLPCNLLILGEGSF